MLVKNGVSRSMFSKVRAQTGQTDRQTKTDATKTVTTTRDATCELNFRPVQYIWPSAKLMQAVRACW